jgi:hypothetical protein
LTKLPEIFDISIPATHSEIAAAENHFNFSFPTDYKEFLLITNGLEGEVNNEYLVLWSIKELIELNTAYHVKEFIENIIIFGSDGAEEAFAFDISDTNPSIVKLPFIGMGYIPNEKLTDTFEGFLSSKVETKNFIKRFFG